MQERRNKRLFILLIVLVSTTIALLWLGNDEGLYKVDKNIFKPIDLQTIDQVTLESAGASTDLKYNGSKWKVNDRFDADRNLIEVLFATLQQAEPKRPVAQALEDSMHQALEKNGVRVKLLSKGAVEKDFIVGGNLQKTQAYFKSADQKQSYLMTIPGYRVYVSGIFELDENGWRDKYVFGFNWRNFQSLTAKFQNPKHDFMVVMDDQYFKIKELPQTDTTKLNDFLDAVSLLTVDEYVSSDTSLINPSAAKALITLIVKDVAQKEYTLQIFNSSQKELHGKLNQGQWAIFKENQISRIIRPKEFFIPQ